MWFSTYLLSIHTLLASENTSVYSMDDFIVLSNERNFKEFLEHVNDVRPSERSNRWKTMYKQMVIDMINYKSTTNDYKKESFQLIENHARSSALFKDEALQIKRNDYVKKYLKTCFSALEKNSSSCLSDLQSYWFFSNKDPDMALHLANLIETHSTGTNAWSYYAVAIKDAGNNYYCNRPEVQKAIFDKINADTFSSGFDNNYKKLITSNIPMECFNKLTTRLREMVRSTDANGLSKELALNLMTETKLLKENESELYATIYLSDGPVVGDRMNISWKIIENLGRNFSQRQKVLEEVKKLSVIPDYTFKHPKNLRNKAIINLFHQNFPELLNYYGESCLNYITHSKDSNISSYQCKEFLAEASDLKNKEKIDWINDKISTQYSATKKK